jgi:hypothetical protein
MSNEIEDFQGGGIYPGGTGLVKEFRFQLWDYDGKQPKDSVCAAKMVFQPTDGSNEGKELIQYWSVGPSSEFAPDGQSDDGFVVSVHARTALSESSNYAFFLKKLRETCGLPKGKLSEGRGVRALEGTELTLARVDQPKREGLAEEAPQPGQQHRKPTTLIPTRAKWGWETGAQPATGTAAPGVRTTRRGAAAAPAAPAQAPAPVAAPLANGNGAASSVTADSIIEALLASGPVNVADLPRLSLDWLTANNITDRQIRLPLSKAMKDTAAVEEMAVVNDWKLENGVLSIPQ